MTGRAFIWAWDFSGKGLDELACEAGVKDGYKIRLDGFEFSLSGMENKVVEMISNRREPGEIAGFVFESVADVLIRASENAKAVYGELPVLFSGGVSSSSYIRSRITDGVFPAPEYATDNALGISLLTYRTLKG